MRNHQTQSTISVALYQPQIPPNTGNIARTCAAFNISLNLIKPLGFSIDDKQLKRAGLDYWDHVMLNIYEDYSMFKSSLSLQNRLIGSSRYGGIPLNEMEFMAGDTILFGREDNGLPSNVRSDCDFITTIPMPGCADESGKNGVRSLNLSVACAVIIYQAINQITT